MRPSVLQLLRCPFCLGKFKSTIALADQISTNGGYDVLSCACGRYPVVAGIPVLKKDKPNEKTIALIEAGQYCEALLVALRHRFPRLLCSKIPLFPYRAAHFLEGLLGQRKLREWEEQARVMLTEQSRHVTARDLIYFLLMGQGEDYFFFRFSQPRYLTALSLVSIIRQPMKPVLDLACGAGHVTRSLVHQAKNQQVIGVDQNFSALYIAKYWIAPEADYVCCDSTSLPFQDDCFSAAFCSDAFHYFKNKALSSRELRRITRDRGIIVLTWVHNVLLRRPYDGCPLPCKEYQALVDDIPHLILAESDLLACYLKKQGPPLAFQADLTHLNQQPTISIIASHSEQEIFRDYEIFNDWPHAQGQLRLNPLYEEEGRDEFGKIRLRRTFPSAFYEEDHAECKEYMPEKIEIGSEILTDLECGRRTQEMEKLIEQFVLVGMPGRYY
jgi:SAM-dependent methyltransferase